MTMPDINLNQDGEFDADVSVQADNKTLYPNKKKKRRSRNISLVMMHVVFKMKPVNVIATILAITLIAVIAIVAAWSML